MIKYLSLLALILSIQVNAEPESDRAQLVEARNIVLNPGFENGKQAWTPSTVAHLTLETTAPGYGNISGIWDATGVNDTLDSDLVAIPAGMFGARCVAEMSYKWASGTDGHISFTVHDGSTTQATVNPKASSAWSIQRLKFNCPSSGSLRIRLVANNASAAAITIDNVSIRRELDDYASHVISAYFAKTTNCTGWTTSSATFAALAQDTDCPAPTVEYNSGIVGIDNTDTFLPKIKLLNVPEGHYQVHITAPVLMNGAAAYACIAVNDGTSTMGSACGVIDATTGAPFHVIGDFVYTTAQASVTFSLFGETNTDTLTIQNGTGLNRTEFQIYRFPRPR